MQTLKRLPKGEPCIFFNALSCGRVLLTMQAVLDIKVIQLYHFIMNYITTNIRILEEDYMRLKREAAQKRTSLAAVIREKIRGQEAPRRSKEEVKKMMDDLDVLAKRNAKHLKGFDSLKALREIRYGRAAKW